MAETIHVRACGTARLPIPGMQGRYVARAPKTHEPLAEGAHVPADGYHLRAIERGDIEMMPPAAKPAKKNEAQS